MWTSEKQDDEGAPVDTLVRRLCARLHTKASAGRATPPLSDNLYEFLLLDPISESPAPREWRLVGQERDLSQLFTWIARPSAGGVDVTHIGTYHHESNDFRLLHQFDVCLNIIQASVNDSRTLLTYVVKETNISLAYENVDYFYKPYLLQLKSKNPIKAIPIENKRNKQVMVQFLYKKNKSIVQNSIVDKFLLLIHLECMYNFFYTQHFFSLVHDLYI